MSAHKMWKMTFLGNKHGNRGGRITSQTLLTSSYGPKMQRLDRNEDCESALLKIAFVTGFAAALLMLMRIFPPIDHDLTDRAFWTNIIKITHYWMQYSS